MKKLSDCLAAFGLTVVLGIAVFASPLPAQAGPDIKENDRHDRPARPVPITGSVTITGTPAVTVTGTPAVTVTGTPAVTVTGTPAVTITGTPTVNVGNSEASPVLVRDVDRAGGGQQPFTMYHGFFVEDGVGSKNESFGTVPTGKRFVIELVSLEVHIPAGQAPFTELIRHPDFLNVYVPLVQQPNTPEYHVGTFTTRLYVEGGQEITLNAGRRSSPASGIGTVNARLFGYLMDTP